MILSRPSQVDLVHLDMRIRAAIEEMPRKENNHRSEDADDMKLNLQLPPVNYPVESPSYMAATDARISILESELREVWKVMRRLSAELHNRDAKEYNCCVDMFSSLRPLHDLETNRPVGNFPRSMFAIHQMEEPQVDQLLVDVRAHHFAESMGLIEKREYLESFIRGQRVFWIRESRRKL